MIKIDPYTLYNMCKTWNFDDDINIKTLSELKYVAYSYGL